MTRAIGAHDAHRRAVELNYRMPIGLRGQFGIGKEFIEDALRARALQRQHRPLVVRIVDLDFVGDQVAIEMGDNIFFKRLPEIQIDRVHGAKHAHVSDDPALLRENRRLLAVEHFQQADIVGQHALQEGNAIRSGELKQGAMGEIEKAGGGADRLVLGGKVAKVIRQAPTVLFGEYGAVSLVQFREKRLLCHQSGNIASSVDDDNARRVNP